MILLYIWSFLSRGGQRRLSFLKHSPPYITKHKFPHLRENLRTERCHFMQLKRKNMPSPPPPPDFYCLLPYWLGIITPLGGSQTKAGLLQKGPLQCHSFPYPREYGGRGSKRLPPKASHIRPWLLGYQGLPE